MKQADLVRWLRAHDCEPVAGQSRGRHEASRHVATAATSFVPRHREIVARKIRRQLGTPPIPGR